MAKGRRPKMSKPKAGRADGPEEEEGAAAAPQGADKRPAGRPRMNGICVASQKPCWSPGPTHFLKARDGHLVGDPAAIDLGWIQQGLYIAKYHLRENIFSCQSKIYAYMSPNKPPAIRPPLQEENCTMHHEAKCPSRAVNEVSRKGVDRINTGSATDGAAKAESQNDKESGGESAGSSSNQKQEAVETQTLPPAKAAVAANAKPTPKKGTKTKPGPKRKVQGKTQPNRKVTDYYPVRRSSRKSKKELQTEEKKRIDELIESGKEEGMKIDFIDGKGRGVIATRHFNRGEFVVEYHGDLIEITDAKKREAMYAQDPSTGCYMYYFQYLSKTYCVDATKETNRLGRLINHSKCGNCQTKLHDVDGTPHLILVALRDIKAGEELLYDYGDRSKASIEAHPWLKH